MHSTSKKCVIREASFAKTYVVCEVEPAIGLEPIEVKREERSKSCEPGDGQEVPDPMGLCAHKSGDMAHCGCPHLDPTIHKKLWLKYTSAIKQVILAKAQNKRKIVITCWASGCLLNDYLMLQEVFSDNFFLTWKGSLTIQFIDHNYSIPGSYKSTTKINLAALTCAATCIVACGAILGTSKPDNKKVRYSLLTLFLVGCVVSLCFSASKSREFQKSPEENPEDAKLRDLAQKAQDDFMTKIPSAIPMKLKTSFFQNYKDCLARGSGRTDLLLGYDIDNSVSDLEALRFVIAKNEVAILVSKQEFNGEVRPFWHRSDAATRLSAPDSWVVDLDSE